MSKYLQFRMTTESNPFFSLRVPEVAACLSFKDLSQLLLHLLQRIDAFRCYSIAFGFTNKEGYASPVCNWTGKSCRFCGIQIFYLVRGYTQSLALLWLCFVSTLYGHRNETSHTSNIRIFLAIVMPAHSRSGQKCSYPILLGCCCLQFSKQFYTVKVSYLCTKPADCCYKKFTIEVQNIYFPSLWQWKY